MDAALLRTSRFLHDYREIVSRIADANPDAADRFCDAVEASLALLSRNPEAGRLAGFPSVPEVRRWGVPGFRNYIVFYHPRPGVFCSSACCMVPENCLPWSAPNSSG